MENDEARRGLQVLLDEDADSTFTCHLLKLVDTSEVERILPSMMHIREKKDLALPVIQRLVEEEVEQTLSEGTLFRRNSLATKACAAYGKHFGAEYMRETLRPSLMSIAGNNPSQLEVDPSKMSSFSPESLLAAQRALRSAAERVLDAIIDAKDNCPANLRRVCSIQRAASAQKFPDSQLTVVGGFLFLRFFVPAITAPDGFGVLPPPLTPATRRAMVLIAKLIQNLANMVEFGAKEPYLAPLNAFILDNKLKMLEFLDSISSVTQRPGRPALPQKTLKVQSDEEREAKAIAEQRHDIEDLNSVMNCFIRIKSKLEAENPHPSHPMGRLIRIIESYSPPLSVQVKIEEGITLEKLAQLAKKSMRVCSKGSWQYCDNVGNVKLFYSESDADVVSVKGEITLSRNATVVLDALWNLNIRRKWDGLLSSGYRVVREDSAYLRVMHYTCAPKESSHQLLAPRQFIVAEHLMLKMIGEVATGEGTLVMFSELPQHVHDECSTHLSARPLDPDSDEKNQQKLDADRDTLVTGMMAPSGYVVTPQKDGSSLVEYILRISLEGGLPRTDQWTPALDMAIQLGKLESLLAEEEATATKFHLSLQPPSAIELRSESSLKLDMINSLQWEEDQFFSGCEREKAVSSVGGEGELCYRGKVSAKVTVTEALAFVWSIDKNVPPPADIAYFPDISCIHIYSPTERLLDIQFHADEPFVANRLFRVFRSLKKKANGSVEIITHSVIWGVNQNVLDLTPGVVFSSEFFDQLVLEPTPHDPKFKCRISRTVFGLGGGSLPVFVWNRMLRKFLEHSLTFLESCHHKTSL